MSTHSRSPWPHIAALVVLSALILGVAGYSIYRYYIGDPRSLQKGYSSAPKPQEVSDQDFSTLREIKKQLKTGLVPALLSKLKALADRSPSFKDAQLLAAESYFTQFESIRDISDLDRAESFARRAQALAPDDAGPLFTLFKIKLARGQTVDAQDILEQLGGLKRGDPRLLVMQSELAERDGRRGDALNDLRALVKQLPNWENLLSLAELEARTGHISDANNHIDRVLSNFPDNRWALEKSAQIELLYGDPAEAQELYRRLILREPQRVDYTNLGNAQVLLGNYEEALASFHQALIMGADNVTVTINLADAELALRHDSVARAGYRNALQHMERNLSGVSLTPGDYATRAQCLAHLDQLSAAKDDIQIALKKSPDDGNVLQAAALVYAVAGDTSQALKWIGKALDEGVNPRWFQLPAFDSLKDNPEYKNMIKAPGATSSR